MLHGKFRQRLMFSKLQTLISNVPGIYYRPQRSCGQGNVFTGVCLSTGGEGVCLSACWDAIPPDGEPPLDGEPPKMENPPDGEPPRMENPPRWSTPPGSRLQHTVYERLVCILLECILVSCGRRV